MYFSCINISQLSQERLKTKGIAQGFYFFLRTWPPRL